MSRSEILITGAGGFIGGHLVAALRARGARAIRAVDVKPLQSWYQRFEDVDSRRLDLRRREQCLEAVDGIGDVYHLASDMGGMGFIEGNKTACMLNILIDAHLLAATQERGARRFFYSSTACVYNADKQRGYDCTPLREDDATPQCLRTDTDRRSSSPSA